MPLSESIAPQGILGLFVFSHPYFQFSPLGPYLWLYI